MNIINFRGGFSFSMKGGPDNSVTHANSSNKVALVPPRIPGFKAKVIVRVGDKVSLGQVLFYNKKNNDLKFSSPASGIVSNITYGNKRILQSIEINVANKKNSSYIKFSHENIDQLSKNKIVDNLINSGIFSKIKTYPGFDFIESKEKFLDDNKNLFISLFSSEPHIADIYNLFENKIYEKLFADGLIVCSKIFKTINIFNRQRDYPEEINECSNNLENVKLHTIENKYPAENPGLQCLLTNSLNKSTMNTYADAFVIIEIGHLFSKGFVIQERYLSISGSGVKNPTNFLVKAGQPIKNLLDDLVENLDSDYRLISGGLLTGKKIHTSDYLSDGDLSLQVVKEDRERTSLVFFRLGLNSLTMTRNWLSALFPKSEYDVSTNNNGEERACIQCGYCYDVCPTGLMPSLLMKSAIINDIEKMEYLSIDECIECELCTFICPSKIEMGQHIKNGKEFIKKEG